MREDYALGYALVSGDGLPIPSTVAKTERAAMVNALVAVYGHPVYAWDSDDQIKRNFERVKTYGDAVVLVSIKRLDRLTTPSA